MPVDMALEPVIVPGGSPRAGGRPSTAALLRQLMNAQAAAR
jgi:hypothetical protein